MAAKRRRSVIFHTRIFSPGHPDARRMQSIDAGAVDAERPQRGRGMPAEWTRDARRVDAKRPQVWTQNARSVDAGRTQSGRRTHTDTVPSYFLAVLYICLIFSPTRLNYYS